MSDVVVNAHLFGSATFNRSGRTIAMSPACATLFAYLLLRHGGWVPRARLLSVVAGEVEESVARRRLNTTVWRLRCALEVDGRPSSAVLASSAHGLAITRACRTWTDVADFVARCSSLPPAQEWDDGAARSAQQAVELYQGPFLDGLYGDWVVNERSQLADLRLRVLLHLAHWHERHDEPDLALRYAHLAVADDPFREEIHRLLIRLYRRAGLPEMAVRQYDICRGLLKAELGVEPQQETRATVSASLGDLRTQAVTAGVAQAVEDLLAIREQLQGLTRVVDRTLAGLRGAHPERADEDLRPGPHHSDADRARRNLSASDPDMGLAGCSLRPERAKAGTSEYV